MTKQVSSSHISSQKTNFDTLYDNTINSNDLAKVQDAACGLYLLREGILTRLDRAPMNVSKDSVVDVEQIKIELQLKLTQIFLHCEKIGPSLVGRVEPLPSPPPTITPAPSIPSDTTNPKDLAVGFGNQGANCWANSLLSMILSMPNFRRAYDAVANHYAQDQANAEDRRHGQMLIEALSAYQTTLQNKATVHYEVTQNVRLAFNHFFPVFSPSCANNEDSWEAMQMLMGRYEEITRQGSNPLPQPYSQLQTKRQYRPIGEPYPVDAKKNDYSSLTTGNVSSIVNDDYQIILDLQNKGHLSFSALLSEYFCNTHLQGNDLATYLLPDGMNVQTFELIGEGRQFLQVPEELLLTIKRFGAESNGAGFKIFTPLSVPQTLVLPSSATSANAPVSYELDTFNVHDGSFSEGHYIAYRKINGRWIEANDGAIRFVSDQEIDQILFGQKGPRYTSYMHHYRRIAQSQQQSIAVQPPSTSVDETKKHGQTIQWLEALNKGDPSALAELEKIAPEIVDAFHYAIWLNDKTPNQPNYGAEHCTAQKLAEIRLPWLIGGQRGANLVEQMLVVQRKKLEIANHRTIAAQLHAFQQKVQSNSVLKDDLTALPTDIQRTLHELIYQSHLKKFGIEHVNHPKYQRQYGKTVLESGDRSKMLTEATEPVLNIWGKTIVEQLISEHQMKAEKLQSAYEKEKLQTLHDLILCPPQDVSSFQLSKFFERLDIRQEIKGKLLWHIWYANGMHDHGSTLFEQNPRCQLNITAPNLARPPLCTPGSNLLTQMIMLLERQSQ